jgi:hypothetical protein
MTDQAVIGSGQAVHAEAILTVEDASPSHAAAPRPQPLLYVGISRERDRMRGKRKPRPPPPWSRCTRADAGLRTGGARPSFTAVVAARGSATTVEPGKKEAFQKFVKSSLKSPSLN